MPEDNYYDEEAESRPDETMDEAVPDEKIALVQTSFFKSPNVKPGDREMVEVMNVYDGEVAIRCIYDEDEDKEMEEEPEGSDAATSKEMARSEMEMGMMG